MSTNILVLLNNNKVVGHSTDTVFGLIAKVKKENIEKINLIKERDIDQPLQILFNKLEDALEVIHIDNETKLYLKKKLRNDTSYIVKVKNEFKNKYLLDSFVGTIMFRIPTGEIQKILKETKMVFATSANKTGEPPISNLTEFKKVFPKLDGAGRGQSKKSSRIIDLTNDKKLIRE